MTTKPRVSVIIRTYNRAAYLREALESVFAQTMRDYELIVADDGSSDDTRELLLQYGSRLTPVLLDHTGNQAAVMNAGIRAARGEFVAFLDDDDIWLPDKLQRQAVLLDSDIRFGFAYGNARLLHSNGHVSAPALAPEQMVRGSVLRAMVRSMCVHTSTAMIRRIWFERSGMFDESRRACEEYFFFLRLAQTTSAVCVPEPVTLIREHAAKLSSSQGLETYVAAIAALELLLKERALPGRVRLEAHRSIARYHAHIAKSLLRGGRTSDARHHAALALAHYPLHKPAWRAALAGLTSWTWLNGRD